MFLQVIREAKPLDRQQEHPVNGPLEGFTAACCLVQLAHALFAMAQVECLFLVTFSEAIFKQLVEL